MPRPFYAMPRDDLIAEIERLRAALQRIDGINDNPAHYNPGIDLVIRAVLGGTEAKQKTISPKETDS